MRKFVSIALAIIATGCEERPELPAFISIDYENSPKPQFRPDLSEFAPIAPLELKFSYKFSESEKDRMSRSESMYRWGNGDQLEAPTIPPLKIFGCSLVVESAVHDDKRWTLYFYDLPVDKRIIPFHRLNNYYQPILFADIEMPGVRMFRFSTGSDSNLVFCQNQREAVLSSARQFLSLSADFSSEGGPDQFSKQVFKTEDVFRGSAKVWLEYRRKAKFNALETVREEIKDTHQIQGFRLVNYFQHASGSEYPKLEIRSEPIPNPIYDGNEGSRIVLPEERFRKPDSGFLSPLDAQILLFLFEVVDFDKALTDAEAEFRKQREFVKEFRAQ